MTMTTMMMMTPRGAAGASTAAATTTVATAAATKQSKHQVRCSRYAGFLLIIMMLHVVWLQFWFGTHHHSSQQSLHKLLPATDATTTTPTTTTTTTTTITTGTKTTNTTTTKNNGGNQMTRTATNPLAMEIESFLQESPHTPAAQWVRLVREYLHFEPTAEAKRLMACRNAVTRARTAKNYALCMGGLSSYRRANQLEKKDDDDMEKLTQLALYYNDEDENGSTTLTKNVYALRRYHHNQQLIPFLGTHTVCLPLMLAGHAVVLHHQQQQQQQQDPYRSVVVELGPFAGLSSKCIVTGMAHKNHNNNNDDNQEKDDDDFLIPFHAFDTFEGFQNHKAITNFASWIQRDFPNYTQKNSNFQFLWELAVHPVYPSAVAHAGFANQDTLNLNTTLAIVPPQQAHHDQPKYLPRMDMISIDSAKSAKSLLEQTKGLGILRKGTIVALMDFEGVREQIKQVYGCLRGGGASASTAASSSNHNNYDGKTSYMLPVYASLSMENWIWIVVRDLDLQDPSLGRCYRHIVNHPEEELARIEAVMDQDVAYLSSSWPLMSMLDPQQQNNTTNNQDEEQEEPDPTIHQEMLVNRTRQGLHAALHEQFRSFDTLAKLYSA